MSWLLANMVTFEIEANSSLEEFTRPLDYFEGKSWLRNYLFCHFIVNLIITILTCGPMAIYETFGGDSQKRTILNQMVTIVCLSSFFVAIFVLTLLARLLLGPLSYQLYWFLFVMPKSIGAFFAVISAVERLIIRYLSIIVWKKLPPIEEIFLGRFLLLLNLVLSLFYATLKSLGKNKEDYLEFLMTGHFDNSEKPIFRLYEPIFKGFILISIFTNLHIFIKKRRAKAKMMPLSEGESQMPKYNTTKSNLSINTTAPHLVFLVAAILMITLPFFIKTDDRILFRCMTDLVLPFSFMYGLGPLYIVVLNSEIVTFNVNLIAEKIKK